MAKKKHPMQPLVRDHLGTVRFQKNHIVEFLLEHGGFDMNRLALMTFDKQDRMQFAQLIGYSVFGFGDLSYADPDVVARADAKAERLK